jgi:hypothetical protein
MAYENEWEREWRERWNRWAHERSYREFLERDMHPDERLDEVGWDIFYCEIARDVPYWIAARDAMDGTYRQRRRVRDDLFRRHAVANRRRYIELHPSAPDLLAWDTQAPEQLAFWRSRLSAAPYVYFIQSGEHGPVKIGMTTRRPEGRLRKLQTGNPDELLLRHVIPDDRSTEAQLHTRFAPARAEARSPDGT